MDDIRRLPSSYDLVFRSVTNTLLYLFHNALDHNDSSALPGHFTRAIPGICNFWQVSITLKCLSIGTTNTTTFPFVQNGKRWLLGVPISKHSMIRCFKLPKFWDI